MIVSPSELPYSESYNLLISSVVPRPIAWVSTVSAAGQPNLAPFSFFNAVCADPPLLAFAWTSAAEAPRRHSRRTQGHTAKRSRDQGICGQHGHARTGRSDEPDQRRIRRVRERIRTGEGVSAILEDRARTQGR